MPLAPYPPAPGSYPAPQVPVFNAAPFAAPRPTRPSQKSGISGVSGNSGVSGISALGAAGQAPGLDSRSLQAHHAIPPGPEPAPPQGHLVTMLLVVIAATAAATIVYFVLPLLT
jgi:hypothetical protein